MWKSIQITPPPSLLPQQFIMMIRIACQQQQFIKAMDLVQCRFQQQSVRRFSNNSKSKNLGQSSLRSAAYDKETDSSSKVVNVSVIGLPNAGKSTLINGLMGRRVVSVSKKVHTTRKNNLAVTNIEETQLVFLDTPGFVSKRSRARHGLDKSMSVDPYNSVKQANVVVAVHDASNFYTRNEIAPEILTALRATTPQVKKFLALNKVDLVKDKVELLRMTKGLLKKKSQHHNIKKSAKSLEQLFSSHEVKLGMKTNEDVPFTQNDELSQFDQVFMISSLTGDGLTQLKNDIVLQGHSSPWKYNDDFSTDQSDEEIIISCIKEQLLDLLSNEIPYNLKIRIDYLGVDEVGILAIQVSIIGHSKRLSSAAMGKGGSTVRLIAAGAERKLAETFERDVLLKVVVKTLSS